MLRESHAGHLVLHLTGTHLTEVVALRDGRLRGEAHRERFLQSEVVGGLMVGQMDHYLVAV